MSQILPTRVMHRYICLQCQSRPNLQLPKQTSNKISHPPLRNLHAAVRPQKKRKVFPAPSRCYSQAAATPTYRYAPLSNRSVIKLEGRDVAEFLQGLLPINVLDETLSLSSKSTYTAFLTAQGRILHDVFIYSPRWSEYRTSAWYIDVDAGSATALMQHLKKHKLRSKFSLEQLPQDAVRLYQVWVESGVRDLPNLDRIFLDHSLRPDLRPQMGARGSISPNDPQTAVTASGYEPATEGLLRDYTIHRMVHGIAEGSSEIIPGAALPQESNIDFLEGIDFHKGCYLGQELTIRTHHTGVVRKRILPCQIYNDQYPIHEGQELPVYNVEAVLPLPPPGSNISKAHAESKGRSRGKWLTGVGNVGLALCRLEMMTDMQLTTESTTFDPNDEFQVTWNGEGEENGGSKVRIKAFVPKWLRSQLQGANSRRQMRRDKLKEEPQEPEEDTFQDDVAREEKLTAS